MGLNLFQRLGFDLANTLTRDVKLAADFLQRMAHAIGKPKTHLQNFLFTGSELAHGLVYVVLEEFPRGCAVWRDRLHVLEEVFEL